MTLARIRYTCENGHIFDAAGSGGAYGILVARGAESNEPGIVELIGNPVYQEVRQALDKMGAYIGLSQNGRSDLLQAVFGVACDPAPDGSRLSLGRKPACPHCGTRKHSSWTHVGRYTEAAFLVTHNEWKGLSSEVRQERLRAAMMERKAKA